MYSFIITIINWTLTLGLSLMELLLDLSHSLFRFSPKFLIYLPFHSSDVFLFIVVVFLLPLPLCLSAVFTSVHCCSIFNGSFSLLSHCVPVSPRWIIAQRTAQQTQVQIMNLQRAHWCLSLERPSKVNKTKQNKKHPGPLWRNLSAK